MGKDEKEAVREERTGCDVGGSIPQHSGSSGDASLPTLAKAHGSQFLMGS